MPKHIEQHSNFMAQTLSNHIQRRCYIMRSKYTRLPSYCRIFQQRFVCLDTENQIPSENTEKSHISTTLQLMYRLPILNELTTLSTCIRNLAFELFSPF